MFIKYMYTQSGNFSTIIMLKLVVAKVTKLVIWFFQSKTLNFVFKFSDLVIINIVTLFWHGVLECVFEYPNTVFILPYWQRLVINATGM